MRYLVAAGAPWGIECYLRHPDRGEWALATTPDGLRLGLEHTPRYVFCLNWSQKIAGPLVTRHTFVNFHCTDLPYGRGGGPLENLIRLGHTHTVITAHRMTNELDAGPVYGKWGPISLAGTKEQICQRFIGPCAALMRWMVEEEPEPTPQIGEPVLFQRLPKVEMRQIWEARS